MTNKILYRLNGLYIVLWVGHVSVTKKLGYGWQLKSNKRGMVVVTWDLKRMKQNAINVSPFGIEKPVGRRLFSTFQHFSTCNTPILFVRSKISFPLPLPPPEWRASPRESVFQFEITGNLRLPASNSEGKLLKENHWLLACTSSRTLRV